MKIKVMALIIITLLLSGCFPTGEKSINPTDIKITPQNGHINMELMENILVDAKVDNTIQKNFNSYNMKLKNYSEEKTKEIFIGKKRIINKTTYNHNGGDIIYYEMENNYSLVKSRDFISFDKKGSHDYLTLIHSEGEFREDMNNVFSHEEILNLKREDALKIVRNTCEKLGIDIVDTPMIYALDYKGLKTQEEKIAKDVEGIKNIRNWVLDDEAYIITYDIQKDGLAIFNKTYSTYNAKEYEINGSKVSAIVNKNGVQYFRADGVYDEFSIKDEKVKTIPIAQALESVKNKYKNVIIDSPIKITNISFVYISVIDSFSDNRYIITPAWILEAKQVIKKGDKSIEKIINIKVDAITGNEIV